MRKEKVLITVMTYPHPSAGYQELVCTAGITESGEWIRLYPVDYRYRPKGQQFKKYQWIEVELEKADPKKDNRPESYRPVLDSIRILGEPLSSDKNWKFRREIIDDIPTFTRKELEGKHDVDKTSLGIVKPSQILDLEISKADDPNWKPEWQRLFKQGRLFGPEQKDLRKIPHEFRYVFKCKDSEKPHKAMCEDWELGVLFLKESQRLGSDAAAAQSVKKKFFDEICGDDKDTHFFMGTRFPYNTWLVLGVFWPPLEPQKKMF